MERSYTHHDIEKFLNDFRKLSNQYKIEKVHLLLNNPDARARYSVKPNHKPFNFIFMTSAFIIGLSAFLFFSDMEKINNGEVSTLIVTDAFAEVTRDSGLFSGTPKTDKPVARKPSVLKNDNPGAEMSSKVVPDSGTDKEITADLKETESGNPSYSSENPVQSFPVNETLADWKKPDPAGPCVWPEDTVIDKKSLLLVLTDNELKAIGISRKGDAFYYHNIIEGTYNLGFYRYSKLFSDEEKKPTYNKFYIVNRTNSKFEPEESGDFYSSMDTLVPVQVSNDEEGLIAWFTPHESFFSFLPDRYKYLGTVYKNLVCLKKQNPVRSFTNYLDIGYERVLDPVNILKLNNEELRGIGVVIDGESVKFYSRNKNYTLELSKTGTSRTGNSDDFLVFPPNPYPVLMTDTLGRRIFNLKTVSDPDTLSGIMNILVPVRVNVSKIAGKYHQDMICWYYPDKDFLNSLPDRIGSGMKRELDIITKGSKGSSASCSYFEVCKSSLELNNFKVYPNPASSSVTVEFDNQEEEIGFISLVNMSGSKIRELVTNTSFLSGHNSFQMNLSGIAPGIYLISVYTKRGFRTQRLIITQ